MTGIARKCDFPNCDCHLEDNGRHNCKKYAQNRFTVYEHHGVEVVTFANLKGKHRDHCLCYSCDKFTPMHSVDPPPCAIAAAVFANCVKFNIVTPVWECPEFVPTAKGA